MTSPNESIAVKTKVVMNGNRAPEKKASMDMGGTTEKELGLAGKVPKCLANANQF